MIIDFGEAPLISIRARYLKVQETFTCWFCYPVKSIVFLGGVHVRIFSLVMVAFLLIVYILLLLVNIRINKPLLIYHVFTHPYFIMVSHESGLK